MIRDFQKIMNDFMQHSQKQKWKIENKENDEAIRMIVINIAVLEYYSK